jgi:ankyrin repeat protein
MLNYKMVLHQAVKKGYVDVVEDLLERGASVSATNNANKTPIDIAQEMLEKGEHTKKITKILDLLHKFGMFLILIVT